MLNNGSLVLMLATLFRTFVWEYLNVFGWTISDIELWHIIFYYERTVCALDLWNKNPWQIPKQMMHSSIDMQLGNGVWKGKEVMECKSFVDWANENCIEVLVEGNRMNIWYTYGYIWWCINDDLSLIFSVSLKLQQHAQHLAILAKSRSFNFEGQI